MKRRRFSETQSNEYQHHYEVAWTLLKSAMRVATTPRSDESRRDAALAAIGHFHACLEIVPDAWPSMWGQGKAHQAIGEHAAALDWFERTSQIETGNADVWREATAEALAVGDAPRAVQYAQNAVQLQPENSGLYANLALSFLLAGRDGDAQNAARISCRGDPDDETNQRVLRLVEAVITGDRERPRCFEERAHEL